MAFLPNMTKETLATLMEMLQTGELCDLLVKGNDDLKVHNIHALVFASASSKLEKYCDRTPGKVNVLPFSGMVLEEVIKLAYHGKCDINEAILVEAIDVSTNYKLDIMKSGCKSFLLNNLTVSNMLEFFRIAKNIPGDNQGVRVANWVRELIIGIETVCDRRKPKYAINRTILDKNFHKQLILRYIGIERP